MALFEQGLYRESTRELLQAPPLIRELEQISVSEETSATITGEWAKSYQGEYSEQLWVHTYLMMNFLMMGEIQDALVEGKQALEVFDRHAKALAHDDFTRALVGLCYENMGLFDDARIEYRHIKAFHNSSWTPGIPDGKGELVIFAAQGRVPIKVSRDLALLPSVHISIPDYTGGMTGSSIILRKGTDPFPDPGFVQTDLSRVARESLDERMDALLIRQGIRAGAKEGVARLAGNQSDNVEIMVRIVLFLLEQADTRSWQTLPGTLKLYRIPLEAGDHSLTLLDSGTGQSRILKKINIIPGKRVYRSVRF